MLESELETQLRHLRDALDAQPSLVACVMREVRANRITPPPGARRWLLPVSFGLAASVAVVGWLTFGIRTAPAYGIEDAIKAMLQVKSVHFKGKIFMRDKKGVTEAPNETYVERPCRSWGQGVAFCDDHPPRITYHARDGKSWKFVDPSEKRYTISDDQPLLAELDVERTLQNLLIEKLRAGGREQFRKVGEEKINGRQTERYERVQLDSETWRGSGKYNGGKYVVWLDPTTGLPIRTASYEFDGPRPDELHLWVIEDIETNVPARPEMFNFEPPQGYEVTDARGGKQKLEFHGSAGSKSERMGVGPVSLNIDDRALLVCWAAYDVSQTPPLESELKGPVGRVIQQGKFSVDSGPNQYHLVFLRSDAGDDCHWRWSLLVPVEPKRRIGDDAPTIRMHTKDGGSMGIGISGLRFPRERLESLVVEIQRLTLPPDAPGDAIVTLARIEEIIARVYREDGNRQAP